MRVVERVLHRIAPFHDLAPQRILGCFLTTTLLWLKYREINFHGTIMIDPYSQIRSARALLLTCLVQDGSLRRPSSEWAVMYNRQDTFRELGVTRLMSLLSISLVGDRRSDGRWVRCLSGHLWNQPIDCYGRIDARVSYIVLVHSQLSIAQQRIPDLFQDREITSE